MGQYFDRGTLLLGGGPAASLQSCDVDVDNGSAEVIGLAGYLGVSKGPVMGTVSWDRMVPREGFSASQDLMTAVLQSQFVQVQIVSGGYRFTIEGVPKTIKRKFGAMATANEANAVHGQITVTKL